MNGALNQQINGNDKWCLTPFIAAAGGALAAAEATSVMGGFVIADGLASGAIAGGVVGGAAGVVVGVVAVGIIAMAPSKSCR